MRRSVLPIGIAFIILFAAGAIVTWIFFQRERQFQKIEIPASYLETADSSRFSVTPIMINRNFPDDSVLVFFPKTETHSQVYLYDQKNYNRLLFGDHHGTPEFLPDLEGMSAMFDRPVINLSGFPAGKYYVHVTPCDFGGYLQLNISDSLRK
jgi:hypothetical protein